MTESCKTLQVVDQNFVMSGGERLLYFGGCDYFRMAWHPEVRAAMKQAIDGNAISASASRITTGNHPLFRQLEKRLAGYFGAPSALTVSAGYLANLVVCQGLAGDATHAFIDERAHASLRDGSRFLNCPVETFGHRDVDALKRMLGSLPNGARPAVLTDGVFGHDGSVAPLRAYESFLPRGGMMIVDDAHGAGVVGKDGRGALSVEGVTRRRIVQTVTLSKAFGVSGGAVLGVRELREKIVARSHAFQGSTPLALPLVEAALKAVSLVKRGRDYRLRLAMNAHVARAALSRGGAPVSDSASPIIALEPDSVERADRIVRALRAVGVYPSLISYPGGPEGGWFRFAISSEHSHEQIRTLTDALIEGWRA